MSDVLSDIVFGSAILFLPIFLFGFLMTLLLRLSLIERIVYSFLVAIAIMVSSQILLADLKIPISLYSFLAIGATGAIISLSISLYLGYKKKNIFWFVSNITNVSSKTSLVQLAGNERNARTNTSKVILHKLILYVLPGALFVFYFAAIAYTFPFTTDGDGLTHTIFARDIAEKHALPEYNPYYITGSDNGGSRHVEIDYPLSFHVFIANMWDAGKLNFVKLAPAFFAALTYIVAYLIIREFTTKLAGIAAAWVLVAIAERFIQPVLIEQMLVPFSLGALYGYMMMLKTPQYQKQYIILTGITLGFSVAIKQQGIILIMMILLHFLLYNIFNYLKTKNFSTLQIKKSSSFIFIALIILMPALINLDERNGSFIGTDIPALHWLPFNHPKYLASNQSTQVLSQRISYWFSYHNPFETLYNALTYSFCLGDCPKAVNLDMITLLGASLIIAAFLGVREGLLRTYLSIFGIILFGSILVAYIQTDYISQYHQIALALIVFIFVIGILEIFKFLKKIKNLRSYMLLIIISLILIASVYLISYGFYRTHHNSWGAPVGRMTYAIQGEYVDAGKFMEENIPNNATVLGAEAGIQFYGKHQMLWIHTIGGSKVPIIFESTDVIKSLEWMKYYGIQYIFFDTRQTLWQGASDYINPFGLLKNLDRFENFKSIYNSASGQLKIYKVEYCPPQAFSNDTVIFESDPTTKWNQVVKNNVDSELTHIGGDVNILIKGTGLKSQYTRFEADTSEVNATNSTYISMKWIKTKDTNTYGTIELLGGDSPYAIKLDNSTSNEFHLELPQGLKFNKISLDISLSDYSKSIGYFTFNKIKIETPAAICIR